MSFNLKKYEYQEQTAEVEIVGADGSVFVSVTKILQKKSFLAWDNLIPWNTWLSHKLQKKNENLSLKIEK